MTLSRRTWLWTSTAALAAACTRPGPTKLPGAGEAGGGQPEPPRSLSKRGAENLIALAELGAAVRWLHPSDQARALEWEPLLLDGVRSLEAAGSRAELVEGLRGLLAAAAPTVVIWRSAKLDEGDELDEPACPDPETAEAAEAEAKPESRDEAKPEDTGEDQDSASEQSRARPPTHGNGRPPADRPKPPVRTAPGEPSDAESEAGEQSPDAEQPEVEAPSGDSKPDEAEAPEAAAKPVEGEASNAEATSAADEASKADAKPPKADAEDDDDEPPPPLPEALFAPADESLAITQWFRRGYADGLADEPGCARRVAHDPEHEAPCSATPERGRRRRRATPCSGCAAIDARPLAPGAPMRVELPRGLASLVPLGLWTRGGRTLPLDESIDADAPGFAEAQAFDYTLEDRGTRLLLVLRAWSLVRQFGARAHPDPRALLIPALCAAAEDPSPVRLRASVETLLAGFGDGNAALIAETGKPQLRRYVPKLRLAWVEQRVVVARSDAEQLRPGDVVTAIDGASIDVVLAERLGRTPAASASAAIVRTVAGLLERDAKGATIELALVRESDEGERELSVTLAAELRSDRVDEPADARPAKPIVQYEGGRVYLDATRMRGLPRRRLRKASQVIVDLRGELADPRGSLLSHWLDAPLVVATERMPTGPDAHGELPLEPAGERRVEPDGPRLRARVIVLADARTRGRAELELAGFDRLGATVIGSASAGDLGGVATAWLPGGWRLRWTHSELRRPDGTALWGGVRPSIFVEPTRASLRAGEDLLLTAALAQPR